MQFFKSAAISITFFTIILFATIYIVSAVFIVGSSDAQYLAVNSVFALWVLLYWGVHISRRGPFWLNSIIYVISFALMSWIHGRTPNAIVIGTILIMSFFIFTFEKIRRIYS